MDTVQSVPENRSYRARCGTCTVLVRTGTVRYEYVLYCNARDAVLEGEGNENVCELLSTID